MQTPILADSRVRVVHSNNRDKKVTFPIKMFKNMSYIEQNLRNYIFLGYESKMYYSNKHGQRLLKPKKQNEIAGVRLIAKIVKNNVIEDINSIVPTILKINKENKFFDDKHIIFLLAVCAKYSVDQCKEMINDAYEAINIICNNGQKLLMFTSFCLTAGDILYYEGFLLIKHNGFGKGFRKAVTKWYLNKDPLELARNVVGIKSYNGVTHKKIIESIRVYSNDPCYQIVITYVLYGINTVRRVFESKIENNENDSIIDVYKRKLLKIIYNYITQTKEMNNMTRKEIQHEVASNRRGREMDVVPYSALKDRNVLISVVMHVPLKTLLDKTFFFSKLHLFYNKMGYEDCWYYMFRFTPRELKETQIDPISVYLEYLRYIETNGVITKFKNSNGTMGTFNAVECNPNNVWSSIPTIEKKKRRRKGKKYSTKKTKKQIFESLISRGLPLPALFIKQFLSNTLLRKTLRNILPCNRRIAIAYEADISILQMKCMYMHMKFLKVIDAITLTVMSVVYPEYKRYHHKAIVYSLYGFGVPFKKVKINYRKQIKFKNLKATLFNEILFTYETMEDQRGKKASNPISTMLDAVLHLYKYDVFIFLGTTKMFLRNILEAKQKYQQYLQKEVKIIVVCMNGKHGQETTLIRDGMLYICGFDKNVGKVINSFLRGYF